MRNPGPQPPLGLDPFGAAPSLTSVLTDLGHDCPGTCAVADAELGAPVWFVRRRLNHQSTNDAALVVLDATGYTGSLTRSRRLLREVNECTLRHGIRVSERRADDAGHALATVSALRSSRPGTRATTQMLEGGAAS
jgi:hypothetical protein